jgi:hypothetical protein
MTVANWTWLLAIEGVQLGGSYRPVALSQIDNPSDSLRPEGPVFGGYLPVIVRDGVRIGGQELNVLGGDPPAQSLAVTIQITDAIFDALFTQPRAIGVLTATLTPDDTSFNVTVPTGTLETVIGGDPTTLWIGREAFVGSATGNTFTLSPTTNPAGLIYPDCGTAMDVNRAAASDGDLGHLFTTTITHIPSVAPGGQDVRVFAANPVLRGRRLYLYRGGYSGGDWIEQIVGQYVLSDDLDFGADAVEITITGNSLIGSQTAAKLNTRPVTYPLQFNPALGTGQLVAAAGYIPIPTVSSAYVRADTDLETVRVPMALQSRALLTQGQVGIGGADTYSPAVFIGDVPDLRFGYADGLPSETDSPSVGTFNELLVSDPSIVLTDDHHPYWDGLIIQQNPILMALQHLGQYPSNLPDNWTLNIGPDAVDTDGIEAVAQYYAGRAWPGVVAGGDGKSVPAMAWITQTFLRPVGAGWATDQYGRLTVRSLLRPEQSLVSILQSNTLYGRGQRRTLSVAAEAVRINIGQGGGDSPRVIVNALDQYQPDPGAPLADTYAIDGRGYLAADGTATGLELLSEPGVIFARALASSLGEYLRSGPIQALVNVTSADLSAMDPDAVQSLLPGELVDLTLIGLRGRNNVTVQGIIVGSAWSADFTSRSLRVLVLDIALRRWSAAAEIATVTDNGDGTYTLTFSADDTVTPLPYDYSTDLATLQDQFARGGVFLSLRNEYLLELETSVQFDGTDTITSSTAPSVGDWLVLGGLGQNTTVEALFGFVGRDQWGI